MNVKDLKTWLETKNNDSSIKIANGTLWAGEEFISLEYEPIVEPHSQDPNEQPKTTSS